MPDGYWNLFEDWKQIASGLGWGLGYFGMPHIIVRFMSVRSDRDLKKSAKIGIVWNVLIITFSVAAGCIGHLLLGDIEEIAECMVYGKETAGNELIVTCRALPNYEKITARYGNVSNQEIYDIIQAKIKDLNRKLTNYKAIKRLELKDGEFIKTSTKKIKRFAEIREGKILDVGK